MFSSLSDLYLSGSVTAVAEEWNELRREVLEYALGKVNKAKALANPNGLFQQMEREMDARLLRYGRDYVALRCGEALWALATAPPLAVRTDADDVDEPFLAAPRIMVAVHGPGAGRTVAEKDNPPTVFVMLDARGTLVDFLACAQLSGSNARGPTGAGGAGGILADARFARDAQRLRKKIMEHAPNIVLVGASSGLAAKQLRRGGGRPAHASCGCGVVCSALSLPVLLWQSLARTHAPLSKTSPLQPP